MAEASEVGIEGFPGRHWQMLNDRRIQCDVCSRECRLQDGQRGFASCGPAVAIKSSLPHTGAPAVIALIN